MVICGLLTGAAGVAVAAVAWWPIRRAPTISMLVSSLAVLILIESLIEVLVSPLPMVVTAPVDNHTYKVLGAYLSSLQVVMLVGGVVLTFLLYRFIRSSRFGRAIRAVASNPESAVVLGRQHSFHRLCRFRNRRGPGRHLGSAGEHELRSGELHDG